MKKLIKSVEKRIRKMSFWDISLVKFGSMLFGAMLGVYFATDIEEKGYFGYIVGLFVLSYVLAIFRFFKKK